MNQQTGSASSKLTLLALAHLCEETFECSPSVFYLATATELNERTVCRNLPALARLGFITDTKKRAGCRRKIRVWRLEVPQ
jgi:pyocin large subunit-like protein